MSGNILELQDSRELSASQLHLLLHPTQEEEDERLRQSDKLMVLNIGGRRHWVMSRNFVSFPGTRLGKLARAAGKSDEEEVSIVVDSCYTARANCFCVMKSRSEAKIFFYRELF